MIVAHSTHSLSGRAALLRRLGSRGGLPRLLDARLLDARLLWGGLRRGRGQALQRGGGRVLMNEVPLYSESRPPGRFPVRIILRASCFSSCRWGSAGVQVVPSGRGMHQLGHDVTRDHPPGRLQLVLHRPTVGS